MKDVINYKGFIGSVHFSANDNLFFGKIEGINDLVTFEGESVKELTDAFRYVVDEHIRDCEIENIEAEKSYKGCLNVRISPELHRRIAFTAKLRGVSINKIINEALSNTVAH
jgi:predicted HicB family RNase H-like nuclease